MPKSSKAQATAWAKLVADMQETLNAVEQDHQSLGDALNSNSKPELRQALTIALASLADARRRKSIARATGLDEAYLESHLKPLLEAVLKEEDDSATGS